MKKILLALTLLSALPFGMRAQIMSDYAYSNYSGVYSTDFNPSYIADNRMKLDVNVFAMGMQLQNNYAGMSKTAFAHNGSFFGALKDSAGFPAFNDKNFQDDYMTTRDNSDKKSVFLGTRAMMPLSFMITIDSKSALSITGEFRSYMNLDGVEQPLAKLAYTGFKDSSLWTQQFTNDHLSLQFMAWHEIGFDYARVLVDDKANFLKVGVRPKLLFGLGSVYLFADNLKYLTNNEDTLTFFNSHIQYGHSTNFDFPKGSTASDYIEKSVSHPGIGLDIGVVYEWRPDYQKYKYDMDGETDLWMRSKNKYKLRAGMSITDIGSIKYDRGKLSNNFVADINMWNVHNLNFKGDTTGGNQYMGPVQAWDDTIRNRFGSISSPNTYRVNLPLAFRGDVDYQIWKDVYVNMNWAYAVQWRLNPNKVHDLSYIAITPRWDWKWFGVMIPFSYNQYKNFNVGACVRLGPLFMGTTSLAPYFSKSKTIYGADFYFGIHVPILYREPKDRDKDKVSNKKDKCIDVPGVWEFLGCPDRDGDHVQDSEDLCPDDPGLKSLNGCPDKDGDGITDKQDACPDDPGLPQFNGCPDKDGDGIIDKDDDCPDEPGLPAFKGCPDRDGDGVMDKIDLCPDKPGPADNEGCPEVRLALVDLAGQSLQSVRQAKDGSFTYESLPKDSLCVFRLDGDPDKTMGVNEVKVIVNGLAKRAVRSQADGLFRFEIPKPVGNGLQKMDIPDVAVTLTKEQQEVVKKAFDNLEFETAKAIIRPGSLPDLDTLAQLLKKHSEWSLKISGHTDNEGTPADNLKLSQRRAEAVKNYLVSKGVPANHLKTEWFGQTRPIASNATPEGRQKNRRVEMLIIDYTKPESGGTQTKTPVKTPAKKPAGGTKPK
ncbi:MAG: OmpA family protein [Bacteroidetes bacterium]|nr:OmpA family protein [Bacteroidota bacterium]